MSKPHKCYRCRLPAPEPEHLYQRGDGTWLCMPCLVLLQYEAEMTALNYGSDQMMRRHAHHVDPALDCPLCAYGVV